MGRICPILNHPLKDGVLVEDEALVKFIQKRNFDFLPNELVCQWCKQEVTKLYNKKLKKAIELRREKSRLHEESVSSLKTSKSSSASTTSVRSLEHSKSIQRVQVVNEHNSNKESTNTTSPQLNSSKTSSIEQNNRDGNPSNVSNVETVEVVSTVLSTSFSNTHSILQENQTNQRTNNRILPQIFGKQFNVTARKKTIKDYLTITAPKQNITHQVTTAPPRTADDEEDVIRRLSQEPTTSNAPNTSKRSLAEIVDSDDDDDAIVSTSSQEATRSTVVNANKRRLVVAVDSDDDDEERLSLNAVNGTRLPNVQPIPPKRKSRADRSHTLAQDVMNEYIKDITGG